MSEESFDNTIGMLKLGELDLGEPILTVYDVKRNNAVYNDQSLADLASQERALRQKQDALKAGNGIVISGNEIREDTSVVDLETYTNSEYVNQRLELRFGSLVQDFVSGTFYKSVQDANTRKVNGGFVGGEDKTPIKCGTARGELQKKQDKFSSAGNAVSPIVKRTIESASDTTLATSGSIARAIKKKFSRSDMFHIDDEVREGRFANPVHSGTAFEFIERKISSDRVELGSGNEFADGRLAYRTTTLIDEHGKMPIDSVDSATALVADVRNLETILGPLPVFVRYNSPSSGGVVYVNVAHDSAIMIDAMRESVFHILFDLQHEINATVMVMAGVRGTIENDTESTPRNGVFKILLDMDVVRITRPVVLNLDAGEKYLLKFIGVGDGKVVLDVLGPLATVTVED